MSSYYYYYYYYYYTTYVNVVASIQHQLLWGEAGEADEEISLVGR